MPGEKEPLQENNQDGDISLPGLTTNVTFELEDLSITVKKGVKMSDIGYCQINFYQLPNETESYESSEKYKISAAEVAEREINWKLGEKATLKMKLEPLVEQYQIRIELFSKNGNRKEIGKFHIGMTDVADDIPDKGKKRNLKSSSSKKVSAVDIKYKIYKEVFENLSFSPTTSLGTPKKLSNNRPTVVLNSTIDSPNPPTSIDVLDSTTKPPSPPANDVLDDGKNQNLQPSIRSSIRNLNIRKSLNFSRTSLNSSSKRHSRKLSNDFPPDILEFASDSPSYPALSDVLESKTESPFLPATTEVHQSIKESPSSAAPMDILQSTIDSNSFPIPTSDEPSKRPAWKPKSCIIVIGTTGRGKTTTVNIYTGQNAQTGNASHSTTKLTRMYRDILPEHEVQPDEVMYPFWLDTVGLDESEAEINNGELLKSYLECLQKKGMSWVHAVIWNITPEEKQIQMLADQAKFIKDILGPIKENIWKNVIIIVKGMCNDKDFQGALSAVSAIEKGHQGIVDSIQRLQYSLDVTDETQVRMARTKINEALCNITEPLQVIFTNKICLDCGQKGDERLLSDMCHEELEKVPKTLLKFKIKKKICSHCRKKWTRKQFGQWKYTQGVPCVRIRNTRDIGDGETMATNKKRHNMGDIAKSSAYWCTAPQTLQ